MAYETMNDKLLYIPNYGLQNYPVIKVFFRFKKLGSKNKSWLTFEVVILVILEDTFIRLISIVFMCVWVWVLCVCVRVCVCVCVCVCIIVHMLKKGICVQI